MTIFVLSTTVSCSNGPPARLQIESWTTLPSSAFNFVKQFSTLVGEVCTVTVLSKAQHTDHWLAEDYSLACSPELRRVNVLLRALREVFHFEWTKSAPLRHLAEMENFAAVTNISAILDVRSANLYGTRNYTVRRVFFFRLWKWLAHSSVIRKGTSACTLNVV